MSVQIAMNTLVSHLKDVNHSAISVLSFITSRCGLEGTYDAPAAATRSSDPKYITYLLKGCTPLLLAVHFDRLDVVQLLIESKADPAARRAFLKETALHIAVRNNNLAMVTYLVEQGKCDVLAKNEADVSPLAYAIEEGRLRVAEYLAQWAIPDDALAVAILCRSDGLARRLLKRGCNPNSRRKRRWTPLFAAIEMRDVSRVKLLLEFGADPNMLSRGWSPHTPLQKAFHSGQPDMVQILASYGADIDVPADDGTALLYTAIVKRDYATAMYLLEHGADPTIACGIPMRTPLHVACSQYYQSTTPLLPLVKALVGRGADVNHVDSEKETPLHLAISKGQADVAKYLIEHGADVHIQNGEERATPLHLACQESSMIEVVKILVAKGAHLDVPTHEGWTPLHSAYCERNGIYLLQHGADLNVADPMSQYTPLHLASINGNMKILKALVESGALLDPISKRGTPLHIAIDFRRTEFALYLLAQGADGKARTCSGKTPLHLVNDYTLEVARALIANGDPLDAVDNDGNTPLHQAIKMKQLNVALLILGQKNAVPTLSMIGEGGRTPLQLAHDEGLRMVSHFIANILGNRATV